MSVAIPLSGQRGEGLVTLVDDEAAATLPERPWWLHSKGYAWTKVDGAPQFLHRIVSGAPAGVQVDHRNGNRLDNRQSNLRFATQAQQTANARSRGQWARGVSRTSAGRWIATIRPGNQRVYLGTFDTEVEAAAAFHGAAVVVFGEFAPGLSRVGLRCEQA